jgi:acarbose 7IV-phosphotransferase
VSGFLSTWLAGRGARPAALSGAVAGAWACGTEGTHTGLIDATQLAAQVERLSRV